MPYRSPTAIQWVAVLLAVEILGFSFWIDTVSLSGRSGFTEAVGEYGPSALSALITFVACWYALIRIRHRTKVWDRAPSRFHTSRRHLLGHFLAALASVALLVYVLNTRTSGIVSDVTMALWIIVVGVAVLFAVLAAVSRGEQRPPLSRRAWTQSSGRFRLRC